MQIHKIQHQYALYKAFFGGRGRSFLIYRYFEIYAPSLSLGQKLLKQNLNSYNNFSKPKQQQIVYCPFPLPVLATKLSCKNQFNQIFYLSVRRNIRSSLACQVLQPNYKTLGSRSKAWYKIAILSGPEKWPNKLQQQDQAWKFEISLNSF